MQERTSGHGALIVYEMVMGRRAYEGRDLAFLVKSIVTEPPIQWSEFKAQVPSDIFAVISKCLLKDPAGRFSSFGELAAASIDSSPWVMSRSLSLSGRSGGRRHSSHQRISAAESLDHVVRPHLDSATSYVKHTELMLLTQAQRSRKIGDTNAALLALKKLFGSEPEWGKRWASLTAERDDPSLSFDSIRAVCTCSWKVAADICCRVRLAAFLDTIYDESRTRSMRWWLICKPAWR